MSSTRMRQDLTRIVAEHDFRSPIATAIPRLTIWSSSGPTEATPAMFEPKFYMVVQGAKRLVIGGDDLRFEAGSCAVSSIGMPFTSQVVEASSDRPYIGVEIGVDPGIIAGLLLDLRDAGERNAPAFSATQAPADIAEVLDRFVRLLASPADIPVLVHQIERELYYRLLQGPMGRTLRQIVQKNTRFDQVRKAVEWIRNNADKPIRVERLAASVGMSVTSFHRHFKAVTSYSPLVYQRHIRLLDAQRLIISGATNVTRAAFATGYVSSSQFSREYKRMFGVPPIRDAMLKHH